MNRLAFAVLCLLAVLPAGAARLELKPCRLPEIEGEALRCGTYEVFEDRSAGKGRKIPLRVVVVPADRLTAELVERGTAEGLDLEGCRRSIRRPPFATSLEQLW